MAKPRSRLAPHWVALVGLVFLVGGIWGLAGTLPELRRAYLSLRWPAVPGIVTAVGSARLPHERFVSRPTWELDYTYTARGSEYTGVLRLSPRRSTDLFGTNIRDYHRGQRVDVRYNPDHPADSVLHFDANPGNYLALLTPFPILAVGLFLLVRGLTGHSVPIAGRRGSG